MLSDLIEQHGLPLGTKCEEVFIMGNDECVENGEDDEHDVLQLEDCKILPFSSLHKILMPNTALVFTASQHTTAMYRSKIDDDSLYCFDSLTGVVVQCVPKDAQKTLERFHNLCTPFEAFGVLIQKI